MSFAKLLVVPIAAASLFAAPAALAHEHATSEPHDGDASAAPVKIAKGTQVVELAVTKDGFVPSLVSVKAGKTVTLVVTRKVERTCATEIVSKDLGTNRPLPFEKAVTVTVTPKKAGSYRFGCPMDMIAGTLDVE